MLVVDSNFAFYCSPYETNTNFDHFCPLPARPNVIWLQKVVSNTTFTYEEKPQKIGNFLFEQLLGNHIYMIGGAFGACQLLLPHLKIL